MCSYCSVFGHKVEKCGCRPRTEKEKEEEKKEEERKKEEAAKNEKDGFIQVNRKKPSYNTNYSRKNTGNVQGNGKNNVIYKPIVKEKSQKEVGVESSNQNTKEQRSGDVVNGSPNERTKWNVNKEVIDNIKRSANKFSVLRDDPGDEETSDEENKANEEEEDVLVDLDSSASKTTRNEFKIATWNIRGLGKLSKQNAVKNLMRDENLSVCAILETKLKGQKVSKIGTKVFGRWEWIDNANECSRGYQAMLCLIEILSTKEKLLCTFIHAETLGRLRKTLWADLSNYKSICNNNPWVLMGDINVSLNFEDHSEGISYKSQDMEEFQDCVNKLKIDDVASSGLHFTWTKSLLNPNSSILKKIDRIMGNEEFFDVYKKAYGVFLPYGISDHSPAILTCSNSLQKSARSFRFANYIADKTDFLKEVEENWNIDVEGFNMYKLVKKLKAMKPVMNRLNWKNGNLTEKVKSLKKSLDEIQMKLDKDPHNMLLRNQSVEILNDYSIALEDEEKLMFQKAKVEWLNDGDKNTAFFHKAIKGRMNRNRVNEIWGTDDIRYTGDQVPIQFVNHFKSFLGPQNAKECLDLDSSIFYNHVSQQYAEDMITEVSNEEIKDAMFSIDDNKAPGPDGFTAKFYKKAWNTIGGDICNAVKEFFKEGKLLGELNSTLITLVPKVSIPNKVTDFRPIACCNVVYKCISKILTNRIKNVLDSIVDKNQSSFIPDRQITDNILLTQELLKGYDCSKGPKRCSMKIDIQKAYDTVDWSFLDKALRMFGFPNKMVKWIMVCVTNPSYSICINGERHGFFKGGRGLRQGDPLSPYLFTIVMEIFNLILKQKIRLEPSFKYHHGCKKLQITHLYFADDLLVMCHRDTTSVKVIKSALEDFSKLPVRYLGVPLVSKSIGVKDCKILASIQVYWASVFRLPKAVSKDIEKIFKSFLWNNGESINGKAKVSWKDVCQPKENGGLGFKPIDQWNKALLIKHLWNVANKKDTLWVKWVNMYKVGNGCSVSLWHDSWSMLPTLDTFIRRREIFAAGFSNETTLAEGIVDNKWKWLEQWLTNQPNLNQYPVPTINNEIKDKLMWCSSNGIIKSFSSSQVWKDIKFLNEKMPWWKRMMNVWNLNDLENCLIELSKMPCKNSIWSIVRRLSIASTVYHIWLERNARIFQQKRHDCTYLVVYSVHLGLERKLDWVDERGIEDTIEGGCSLPVMPFHLSFNSVW
ncbi:RNA-directed DNA polymerase, eukaryota, reverse transcriptase zinc-binding domain protein [Tanacetum coccineum]|uniref:RNA-directed DNA polymerase, eukaryota, reverse transcriptase zinc-binding domain protein n=1 Tax=Tanacetum coccineum TaxID=301880 RepID=A0ABQ5APX7_9ASTR